jgi:DNA-binding CsgD family transcriptional regulator
LACSEATVNFHFANIRRKFAVGSRSVAVLLALEKGLISLC